MLVKLAQLAADIPEIRELDINPLLADHTGVLALDARVAIGPIERKFAGPGNARFAVRPYPDRMAARADDAGWPAYPRAADPAGRRAGHSRIPAAHHCLTICGCGSSAR